MSVFLIIILLKGLIVADLDSKAVVAILLFGRNLGYSLEGCILGCFGFIHHTELILVVGSLKNAFATA